MAEEISEKDFKEKVLERSKKIPVIVDFWAPWCMPCVFLAPILENAVKEFKNKVVLVKVNVQENPRLAMKYGIMSIPNVKMFRNGKVVDEFIGLQSEDFIKNWIRKNLKS